MNNFPTPGTIKVNGFKKVKDGETTICKAGNLLFIPVRTFTNAWYAVCYMERVLNPHYRIVKAGTLFHIMDKRDACDVSRAEVIRKVY